MLPTTKIFRLDFKYLIDNALNRKLWGKKWVVFQYDKVTISMRLTNIDIDNNKLMVQLSLAAYDYTTHSPYQGRVTLPLEESHHNFIAIKKSFVGAVRSLITLYEDEIIRRSRGYKRADAFDDALQDEAERRAISILDEQGITHEDIRDAYIDACRSKAYRGHSSTLLSTYRYKTRPHYYLMVAAFFYPEDKEAYETAEKLVDVESVTPKYRHLIEGIDEYIKAVYGEYEDEYLEDIDLDLEQI